MCQVVEEFGIVQCCGLLYIVTWWLVAFPHSSTSTAEYNCFDFVEMCKMIVGSCVEMIMYNKSACSPCAPGGSGRIQHFLLLLGQLPGFVDNDKDMGNCVEKFVDGECLFLVF